MAILASLLIKHLLIYEAMYFILICNSVIIFYTFVSGSYSSVTECYLMRSPHLKFLNSMHRESFQQYIIPQ